MTALELIRNELAVSLALTGCKVTYRRWTAASRAIRRLLQPAAENGQNVLVSSGSCMRQAFGTLLSPC